MFFILIPRLIEIVFLRFFELPGVDWRSTEAYDFEKIFIHKYFLFYVHGEVCEQQPSAPLTTASQKAS